MRMHTQPHYTVRTDLQEALNSLYRELCEPCKTMISVCMHLALNGAKSILEHLYSTHHTPPYIITVHTCLFVFVVNHHDSRIHSTFSLAWPDPLPRRTLSLAV